MIDLHVHSTKSDGTFTPAQLIRKALDRRINVLSLTDHDTVAGVEEITALGEEKGIRVLPGVEISAIYPGGTFHLLGYNIDLTHEGILGMLSKYQHARATRNERMAVKFQEMGIPIHIDELKAGLTANDSLGRPHFAAKLKELGVVTNLNQAFKEYLGTGGKAYIEKEIFTPEEAINIVRQAGGKAVLAHPASLYLEGDQLYQKLAYLKEQGLDGIEAYTSAHNRKQMRIYRDLAIHFGFLISGGSDYHGSNKPSVRLGSCHDGVRIRKEWISEYFWK